MRATVLVPLLALALAVACACRKSTAGPAEAHHAEGWAVTAWGERYEVFAETGALVAGTATSSNAHVTVLDGFAPLRQGAVTLVLRGAGGAEAALSTGTPRARGDLPDRGEAALGRLVRSRLSHRGRGRDRRRRRRPRASRVASLSRRTRRRGRRGGGRVLPEGAAVADDVRDGLGREGTLAESVSGPARVKPAGGGEVVLTAAVDAKVAALSLAARRPRRRGRTGRVPAPPACRRPQPAGAARGRGGPRGRSRRRSQARGTARAASCVSRRRAWPRSSGLARLSLASKPGWPRPAVASPRRPAVPTRTLRSRSGRRGRGASPKSR